MPNSDYLEENVLCEKQFGLGKPLTKLFSRKQLDQIGQSADGSYDGWRTVDLPVMQVQELPPSVIVEDFQLAVNQEINQELPTSGNVEESPALPADMNIAAASLAGIPLFPLVDIPKLPTDEQEKTTQPAATKRGGKKPIAWGSWLVRRRNKYFTINYLREC